MAAATAPGALKAPDSSPPLSPSKDPCSSPSSWHKRTAGAPIDYSFKDLKQVTDLLFEQPVSGTLAHPPIAPGTVINEYLETLASPSTQSETQPTEPLSPSTQGQLNSTSLRVCNNLLTSLKLLDKVTAHLLTDPQELTWLDASCNHLTSIEEVVAKFPKLQVLYLHGNQIHSLHDVQVLTRLEHLQKLTLHGNPVAEKPDYKLWVCAHLPHLRSLDFSTITKVERDKVSVWHRGYLKQKAARE